MNDVKVKKMRKATQERRLHIAKVAAAMFARHGVQATTVRDIGDEVGMQSGSLYHHFSTKHDIVHHLMRSYCDELLTAYKNAVALGGNTMEQLERLFRACMEITIEHPSETAMSINELDGLFQTEEFSYIEQNLQHIEDIYVQVILQGMANGEIRNDVAPAFVYRMMIDVLGAVRRWYDPAKHTEDQVVKGWIDVFFKGISAD